MPDGKVPLVSPPVRPDYLLNTGNTGKRPSVCLQVSGPVFFSSLVSEKLLRTHVTPPLDGCTYLGLDSGAPPLQVTISVHGQLPNGHTNNISQSCSVVLIARTLWLHC